MVLPNHKVHSKHRSCQNSGKTGESILFVYLVFWPINHHVNPHVYFVIYRTGLQEIWGQVVFHRQELWFSSGSAGKTWRCCCVYKTHRGEEMRVSVETQEQIIALRPTQQFNPAMVGYFLRSCICMCVCLCVSEAFISNSCNHANIAWRSTFINCLRLYVACKGDTRTHAHSQISVNAPHKVAD